MKNYYNNIDKIITYDDKIKLYLKSYNYTSFLFKDFKTGNKLFKSIIDNKYKDILIYNKNMNEGVIKVGACFDSLVYDTLSTEYVLSIKSDEFYLLNTDDLNGLLKKYKINRIINN